jgi:hypothetical protein
VGVIVTASGIDPATGSLAQLHNFVHLLFGVTAMLVLALRSRAAATSSAAA